jgi:hypothetical protein
MQAMYRSARTGLSARGSGAERALVAAKVKAGTAWLTFRWCPAVRWLCRPSAHSHPRYLVDRRGGSGLGSDVVLLGPDHLFGSNQTQTNPRDEWVAVMVLGTWVDGDQKCSKRWDMSASSLSASMQLS